MQPSAISLPTPDRDTAPPPAAGAGAEAAPRPWGAWAAVGWSLLLLVAYSLLQGSGLVGLGLLLATSDGGLPTQPAAIGAALSAHFGLVLWLGLLVAAPVTAAAVALVAARGRRQQLAHAVGLVRPPRRAALLWLAAALAVAMAYDLVAAWLGRPPVPEFMAQAYRTAGWLPGLWLAVVVAAPVFEEVLFRGFLLPALARSRLGAAAAVTLTAAAWAAIHLQYDLLDLTAIFVLGLVFGAARLATGSTLLAIGLHLAINLAAMVEAALLLGGQR